MEKYAISDQMEWDKDIWYEVQKLFWLLEWQDWWGNIHKYKQNKCIHITAYK